MEKERGEAKSKDETGFSEKQLSTDIEIGVFKKRKTRIKKVLFEKKAKK
jgi:hypothetical protein